MSDLKRSLYFLALSIFFVFIAKAESSEDVQPEADFLEFLAEVEDATGDDGFEIWLKANPNDEDTEQN